MINLPVKDFEKTTVHLDEEYKKLQIGRASAGLVEGLMVEAYGSMQALKSVAGVSVPDAKTIQIQPWDRSMLAVIEKAIRVSDLNLNPVNNGLSIILSIPPLTEERRRDLAKVVNRLAEEAKISVRNIRHDYMGLLSKAEHDKEIPEDEKNRLEKQMQEKVDEINRSIDSMARAKEQSIMTI